LLVVDAGTRPGGGDQVAQQRGDPLGIDGEFEAWVDEAEGRQRDRVARKFEQPIGIDLDDVAIGRGRSRDCRGDDFALHAQRGNARLDEPGPPLVEEEDAQDEDEQPREVEHDNAAREAREDGDLEDALDRPPQPPKLAEQGPPQPARPAQCG
jgi:hypothetical protein